MDVYIIHAQHLRLRKQSVDNLLQILNTEEATYITEFEGDLSQWKSYFKHEPSGDDMFDAFYGPISIAQASNLLKHAEAIRRIAESDGDRIGLVIEDDVLFDVDSLRSRVTQLVTKLKNDPKLGMIMLGIPIKSNNDKATDEQVVDASLDYPVLAACDSYLMTKEFASKFLLEFVPFRYVTNVNISYTLKQLKHPLWLARNHIFLDGSKYGPFLSSMENNAFLPYNVEFTALQSRVMAEGKEFSDSDLDELEHAAEKLRFQNHPAVIHLRAVIMLHKKQYGKAHTMMQTVYEVLQQNGCVVSGTNPMVKTYVSTFQHTQ